MTRFSLCCTMICAVLPAVAVGSVIDTTPGLLYHLDAAQGVVADGSNNVSAWNDQSANGNNFTQGTATKQPLLISSSAAFNNHPVIEFNGSLVGAGPTAPNAGRLVLNNGTAPQTVFIVEQTNSNNGLDGVWGLNEGDTGIRRTSSTDWQTQPTGNGNDYPTSMFINGVNSHTQPVGTAAVMTAFGNANFGATGLGEYFDCCGATARPWGGDIAEVAVYNTTLTTSQQQAIENFLFQKYFAPVPEPGSMILLGIGGLGLLGIARRRLQA